MTDSRSGTNVPYKIGVRKTDGRCVNIDEVPRGKDCGCICKKCEQPLIAKQGEKNAWHFAHAAQSDCKGMGETHLHLAAKQILKKRREILLPNYRGREFGQSWDEDKEYLTVSMLCSPRHRDLLEESRGIVTKGEIVEADDDVKEEERLEGFQPDIIIPKGDRELLVEIRVTHKTEEEKISRIREREWPCIEIDLSKTPRDISMQDLEGVVVGDGPKHAPRKWLCHPKGEKKDAELRDERKREFKRRIRQDTARKLKVWSARIGSSVVAQCPIYTYRGRHSIRLFDCYDCEHHIVHFDPDYDEELHDELTGKKYKDYAGHGGIVYCACTLEMARKFWREERKREADIDTEELRDEEEVARRSASGKKEPKRRVELKKENYKAFAQRIMPSAKKLKVRQGIVDQCPIAVDIKSRDECICCDHHVHNFDPYEDKDKDFVKCAYPHAPKCEFLPRPG